MASSQLPSQHRASPYLRSSVDFMDELVSSSARFTNGELEDLVNNKLVRAYRRTVAMKLFAKHLADHRPDMLQSLQQFVDAHEAIIGYLNNDYPDCTRTSSPRLTSRHGKPRSTSSSKPGGIECTYSCSHRARSRSSSASIWWRWPTHRINSNHGCGYHQANSNHLSTYARVIALKALLLHPNQ
jgi:hypothetical protein